MPDHISFDELGFDLTSELGKFGGVSLKDRPFRILVVGNFSGRETLRKSKERGCLQVDRDNLDIAMSRLGVRLSLPLSGANQPPEVLSFNALDDFHPDHLYARIPLFQAFRDARKKAKDLKSPGAPPSPSKPEAPLPGPSKIIPTPTGLLDDILDVTGSPDRKPAPRGDADWNAFLADIAAPHAEQDVSVKRTELISGIDAVAAEYMRAILQYPAFQTLESLWRGLAFLVSRAETDEMLQVHILDISKEELAEDLLNPKDLSDTELYRIMVKDTVETPGAFPWSLLVGAYTFGPEASDTSLLSRIGMLAQFSGAPFISAAQDRLLGCNTLAETPDPVDWKPEAPSAAWNALRHRPEAPWIGLLLPRFLLRLPYGSDTDPIDQFHFEEMAGAPDHNAYTWGNPAFACAYLISAAFSRRGWKLRPGEIQDIDRLPLHIYREAGETRIKPCAEVLLTERAAGRILDMGLMPLLSFKEMDMIRLARFQSIADPPTRIARHWE